MKIKTSDFPDVTAKRRAWIKAIFSKDFTVCQKQAPDKLYQYKKINEYSFDQIANSYIYLSDPREFNDPYDSAISPCSIKSLEQKISQITGYPVRSDFMQKLHSDINEKNDHVVSCTTVDYKNMLMWSHYSEMHKGICIEYDYKKYLSMPTKTFAFPVVYTKFINNISNFILTRAVGDRLAIELIEEVVFLSVLLKMRCWRYENEWRFVQRLENVKHNKVKVPVSAVYIGLRASDEDIDVIKMKTKGAGIKYYKMVMPSDSIGLTSMPV